MLIAAALLVCIATVPIAGGRLGHLADLELRHRWTLPSALGLQLVIVYLIPHWPEALLETGHMASYGFAAWFLWANRRVPGLMIIALGGLSNFVAIAVNGGVMPASRAALAMAGLEDEPGQFASSVPVGNAKLQFLGDIFAVPASWPVHNVFSVGDVCIVVGAFVLVHKLGHSALFRPSTGDFRALVSNGAFMRVWGAQAVSNLGDWMYTLAVVTTLAGAGAGAGALAGLLLAQVAPAAVAGALGGQLVDRLPRKVVMIGCHTVSATAVASLLLAGSPSLVHFYAVAACLGVTGALFRPSVHASLPNIVPSRHVVPANAFLTGSFHVALMVGPVLGAAIAAGYGPEPAFLANAASFVVAGALLFGVRMPSHERTRASVRQAIAESFRHVLATRLTRGVMIVIGLVMVAASIRTPLEPLYVIQTLDENPQALGLLGGAWGMGMVLGSGLAPLLARRWPRERLITGMISVVGACVMAAALARSFDPVLAFWAVAGVANAVAVISYQSLLQERTPDRLRGRVVAASEAVLDASLIVGALTAGTLGALAGIRGAFAISGAIFIGTAVLARLLLGSGEPVSQPLPERAAEPSKPVPATA
jgi:MFS family permease